MLEYELHSYKEKWIVDAIQQAVGTISHQISDTTKVERRILRRVGRYISKDIGNRTKHRYIRRIIYEEISASLKLYRREYAEHIADLTSNNEDGRSVEYEPEDVLANVNSRQMELKETITLLAKDDRRRKMILTEWMNGNTNDSDISNTLARVIGGQARSHRIFVQRFRIECRTALTARVV